MARILIVDDEDTIRLALRTALAARHSVDEVADGESALVRLAQGAYDLVLSDLRMGVVDGLQVLAAAKAQEPAPAVILLTAYGSIDNAVAAMKAGADEYLTKPFRLEELEHRVDAVLERRRLREERDLLRSELGRGDAGLLGQSPAFLEVKRLIAQAGPSEVSVLVLGETGAGKEGVARALHASSPRAAKPFVAVNCAAFASSLIESELFGHEKGAFTGAAGQRKGRLELADGGTLFLDEVGDLPPDTQVKLLRAIEQRQFERVGGAVTLKSDFRLVAATHRDLQALIRQGKFREDLYFRLAVFPLPLPPLRQRGQDILLLAKHFLNLKAGGKGLRIPPEAEARLLAYAWPGNVRELQNVIERAALLSPGPLLDLGTALPVASAAGGAEAALGTASLTEHLEQAERRLLAEALHKAEGNQSQAAKLLGIERTTFQYKLKKYGIT
jgi:DNA-binding NtrC family response regulator